MRARWHVFVVGLLCWATSWTTQATPISNHDGDTFKIRGEVRVRVLGVDTPEVGTGEGADRATAFARKWLLKGPVTLTICGQDLYGRILAHVHRDGESLAELLIKAGLGKKR